MITTAQEALKIVKSGDHLFIHSAAATPQLLVNELSKRACELTNVSIYTMHTEGDAPYSSPECADAFKIKTFFVSENVREAVQRGQGSYIPIFLSEVSSLFTKKIIPLDVVLISVSPPDSHGYCSLGTSVDISMVAQQSAQVVIAQVNKYVPRTHGDGLIYVNNINYLVEHDEPLPEIKTIH